MERAFSVITVLLTVVALIEILREKPFNSKLVFINILKAGEVF